MYMYHKINSTFARKAYLTLGLSIQIVKGLLAQGKQITNGYTCSTLLIILRSCVKFHH